MVDWNELNYILKDSLPSNISEQLYELKVVQAFEKLGWSQYRKEISVRESIQFGAANRMHPDIVIRSVEGETHFVVEIKKPSENIEEERFRKQLHSYMRMLRVNMGILIGNKIQVFVDDSSLDLEDLVLIEEIEFENDSEKGKNFTSMFRKEDFSKGLIKEFVDLKLTKKREAKELKKVKNEILALDSEQLKDMIKTMLLDKYDSAILEKAIEGVTIEISSERLIEGRTSLVSSGPKREQFRYIPAKDSFQSFSSSAKVVTDKPTKEGMKIGAFVQQSFRDFFKDNLLASEMISKLQNESYCKLKLNQGRKVLRTISEGTTDEKGYDRYYTKEIFGGKYYLTSQWHQGQWDSLLSWVKEVKSNNRA